MAIGISRVCKFLSPFSRCLLQYRLTHSVLSPEKLQDTIKDSVTAKAYQEIPNLLTSSDQARRNPNPFAFLSTFPLNLRTQVIDEILQSFLLLRPRSRTQIAYACLLSYTLQSSNPFPLSLAVLQQILRSGCIPIPQTHLLLSSAWLQHRHDQSCSVQKILSDMKSTGYDPDCGTCNYLISSLCVVDQLTEAVNVLKGSVPDSESFDIVIKAMCRFRKTAEATGLVKQMVERVGLTPRQGTLVKVASALRANREMWRAVEMVDFLAREDQFVGFEAYEMVAEGCLESKEYILAGKIATRMAENGFLPYIAVRQKIVEGLANIGEWKLACSLRQRFVELQS